MGEEYKSPEWFRTAPIEEVQEYAEKLMGRPYKSGMYYSSSKFKPTGHVFKDFFTELEESTEPEEDVEERYVRKLLARGGWTKERAKRELLRRLLEHKEKEIR